MSDADRPTALADALLGGARPASDEQGADRDPRVVEVAIGERAAIAEAIAERGPVVLATDVVERTVPDPIGFHVDDLLDPRRDLYCGADLLYALRLPPELHEAFARLAADVDVPAAFTTLGGDPPTVATTPEQVTSGETIHWIQRGAGDAAGSGCSR